MTNKIEKLLEGARTEYDVMVRLAPRLAGRPCVIKIKEPATKGSWAETTLRDDGVFEVRIAPWIDEDQTMRSYLHELAHIRLHGPHMAPSNLHKAAGRTVTSDNIPTWEDQADALRDEWLRYGRRHAPAGYSEDGGVLVALMTYYTT